MINDMIKNVYDNYCARKGKKKYYLVFILDQLFPEEVRFDIISQFQCS